MPDRPTLVLLHAFPLTSVIYGGVRRQLEEVADLLTPDLAGFGTSARRTDEPSIDRLADDVVALLDARGVERAVVGGTSMGGYVTLGLVRRHPSRLAAALLANTKASADADTARENRLRIADAVLTVGPTEALRDMEPKLLGATSARTRPSLVGLVHDLVEAAEPTAVAWAQRAMAARPDSIDALAGFDRPVLVLAGEEDALMTPADAEAMAGAAPHGQLDRLAGAGHLSCLESPQEWARLVADWLAGLS